MTGNLINFVRSLGRRSLAVGMLGGLLSLSGCVVHEGYYARPYVRRTYYYAPDGRVYVRETYVRPSTIVVTTPPPAAEPAPPPSAAVAPETPATTALQPLVAPIALYPDPLIAVLLPASTFPQQVQDAGAWLAANPNPTDDAINAQPWEPSVKAIVRYPSVVKQLTNDMQWTNSLGSAYASQPSDVMAAIQQMRAQAVAQGNLKDTTQQVVVQENSVIAIQPANPEVIYVPEYDPVLVYEEYHPVVFTSVYYPCGPWFVYGCDWGGGVLIVGDWHAGYYYHEHGWHRDYAWRGERYRHWERDGRYGPPPHVDRAHYAAAATVRGREAEIHRTMQQHAPERHTVQQRIAQSPRNQMSPQRVPQGQQARFSESQQRGYAQQPGAQQPGAQQRGYAQQPGARQAGPGPQMHSDIQRGAPDRQPAMQQHGSPQHAAARPSERRH